MRGQLAELGGREFRAARPCPKCHTTEAALIPKNGQNTVRCARCGQLSYNAPKTETGDRPRTVETLRRALKPGTQARILDRDNGRCVLCGRSDQPLTIGHLLSVDDGCRLGTDEELINDEANLAAMCEACNLGLGKASVSPRRYAAIMWRLLQAQAVPTRALPPETATSDLAVQRQFDGGR